MLILAFIAYILLCGLLGSYTMTMYALDETPYIEEIFL